MQICPQCNNEFEDDLERCPQCGYNFNIILNCPYRISLKCIHNSKDCFIEGLNYEMCEVYLHKAGI